MLINYSWFQTIMRSCTRSGSREFYAHIFWPAACDYLQAVSAKKYIGSTRYIRKLAQIIDTMSPYHDGAMFQWSSPDVDLQIDQAMAMITRMAYRIENPTSEFFTEMPEDKISEIYSATSNCFAITDKTPRCESIFSVICKLGVDEKNARRQ